MGLEPITAGRPISLYPKIALTLLLAYVGETRTGETCTILECNERNCLLLEISAWVSLLNDAFND